MDYWATTEKYRQCCEKLKCIISNNGRGWIKWLCNIKFQHHSKTSQIKEAVCPEHQCRIKLQHILVCEHLNPCFKTSGTSPAQNKNELTIIHEDMELDRF